MKRKQYKKLIVWNPSSGLGDFLVRAYSIQLLSETCSTTLLNNFPKKETKFVKIILKNNSIQICNYAAIYAKTLSQRINLQLSSLRLKNLNSKKTQNASLVLLSENNSFFGVIKYSFLGWIYFAKHKKYAIKPPGIFQFFGFKNISINSNCHKSVMFFEFAKKVLLAEQIKPIYSKIRFDQNIKKNKNHSFCIGLVPGGKKVYQRWPYFSKIADYLYKRKIAVKIIGTKDESKLCASIAFPRQKILNNLSFYKLMNTIKKCSLLITNDTGPLHLAAYLGVNSIVISGPKLTSWTQYPGTKVQHVFNDPLNLSGTTSAPSLYRYFCIRSLKPSKVISKINKNLHFK